MLLHSGCQSIQIFHNNCGISRGRIAVKRVRRHSCRRVFLIFGILFQSKQDLSRALYLHRFHFIRIHMLQELGITDLLCISIAPEHQIPEHKNQQHRAERRQQYHHDIRSSGRLISVAAIVPRPVPLAAVIVSAAIVVLVHLIVHSNSVSLFTLFLKSHCHYR